MIRYRIQFVINHAFSFLLMVLCGRLQKTCRHSGHMIASFHSHPGCIIPRHIEAGWMLDDRGASILRAGSVPWLERIPGAGLNVMLRSLPEVKHKRWGSLTFIARTFTWWASYDWKSLEECPDYDGPVCLDFYGRLHPKHSNGTVRFHDPTNSYQTISAALLEQFDKRTDHRLLFRRLGVNADKTADDDGVYQLDLFTDYDALKKEKAIQGAMLEIRTRYGRNAVVKGFNMLKGATTIERNGQIGGHRAALD